MKIKYKQNRDKAFTRRQKYEDFYINYYFNLFLGAYELGGLDYQEKHFLLKEMWAKGTILAFNEEDKLFLTSYSPATYNMYNYPIKAQPIIPNNKLNIKLKMRRVDVDCVIGWCQPNQKSVYQMLDNWIQRLVDIDMIINTQLNSHKKPFMITCTPESADRIEEIFNTIMDDEEVCYVDSEDPSKINLLINNSPYIIDKLYEYKKALENEALTYLGIDNIQFEKKERLITDEASGNNAIICDNSDNFVNMMQDFFERIEAILGAKLTIKAIAKPSEEIQEEDEEDEV